MNNKLIICTTFALAVLVVGCSNDVKTTLGIRKEAPDEFMVISNPPLKIPPEFTLEQPATITGLLPINDNFERGIIKAQNLDNLNNSEKKFLTNLEQHDASPTKKLIDAEQSAIDNNNQSQGNLRKTLNSLNGKSKDPVIDPISEKARIKKNVAEGKPINQGKIENKTTSTLGKLFN